MIFQTINGPINEKPKNIHKFECLLHSLDKPAIKYSGGYECWYISGKKHRDGAPAEIFPNGDMYYFKNGLLHNANGPAIILGNIGNYDSNVHIYNCLNRKMPTGHRFPYMWRYYFNGKIV